MYLVYKDEVLVATPQLISQLPLFTSMLEFCQDDDPVIHLPEVKELEKAGLVHLKELICYQQSPEHYTIPSSHLELLAMVRLADYVGADDFVRAAAGWLDMGVHEISNVNPVGRVYQLIRGRYRASRHHDKELTGLCAWCGQWMEKEVVVPCRPSSEPLRKSPCCDLPVHRHCDSGPACRKCHKQLRVLPCVICGA